MMNELNLSMPVRDEVRRVAGRLGNVFLPGLSVESVLLDALERRADLSSARAKLTDLIDGHADVEAFLMTELSPSGACILLHHLNGVHVEWESLKMLRDEIRGTLDRNRQQGGTVGSQE